MPDGRSIASVGDDATARVWSARAATAIDTPLRGPAERLNSIAYSPDGTRIAAAGNDGGLWLWDVARRDGIGTRLSGHTAVVRSVAFSPDGRWIASGSDDATVRLRNASTGANVVTLQGNTGPVTNLAFSPNARQILSGGEDSPPQLWDPVTGASLGAPLRLDVPEVTSVTFGFSPDGTPRIALGGQDGAVWWWKAETGAIRLGEHRDAVTSVAISHDGARLLSASRDATLRLWSSENGAWTSAIVPVGDTGTLRVAFSQDGQRFASLSADGTLQLWDTQTREPIGSPLALLPGAELVAFAFHPNGREIATATSPLSIRSLVQQSPQQQQRSAAQVPLQAPGAAPEIQRWRLDPHPAPPLSGLLPAWHDRLSELLRESGAASLGMAAFLALALLFGLSGGLRQRRVAALLQRATQS